MSLHVDGGEYRPYEASINRVGDSITLCMARAAGGEDVLIVRGDGAGFEGREATVGGERATVAPLNHANAVELRRLIKHTAPSPVLGSDISIGVGDRLGIASPGHLRAFSGYAALPVLAQQSMRELNLTGRNYDEVLDCASFAVLRAGYGGGFGADGDHLKTPDEVRYALGCGYTMITLDSSEHIRGDAAVMTGSEVAALSVHDEAEARYSGKRFLLDGATIEISPPDFARMRLIYSGAIDFVESIYNDVIKSAGRPVDFEISIDETTTPTSPEQHYYIAAELTRRGVRFATIAPRFTGEFQKGIDYIGDIRRFEEELRAHDAIARHFDYKLSVHSGSDKFSVFPIIGEVTRGRFHLKTAGTSWLEAMRAVAIADPDLFREVYEFALRSFEEASKLYHVSATPAGAPDIACMANEELPDVFSDDCARQIMHITYGQILAADGGRTYRERLYGLWRDNEELYAGLLEAHIGRHLAELGVPKTY